MIQGVAPEDYMRNFDPETHTVYAQAAMAFVSGTSTFACRSWANQITNQRVEFQELAKA